MRKTINLRLLPSEAADNQLIKKYIALETGIDPSVLSGFHILKHSIDARSRTPRINLSLQAYIHEDFKPRELQVFNFREVKNATRKVVIIGAGPCGIFAALQCIQHGIKPVLLERGKDVRARRRDIAILNKQGIINPESNYCFGEGGAGTYSDGKLYTRSSKRGDVQRILQLFVHFGAEEKILYEAHPHIGTNKLPGIISAMRNKIMDCGGEFLFEKKVVDFFIQNGEIKSVQTEHGESVEGNAFILATGHSARDIFILLRNKKIEIHFKPFALGVRVEHPQALIDQAQYHCSNRGSFLPPAAYSWVQQVKGKGVFSFCMCPGGIIAPASTAAGELVVNGWSPSKRNNPFANSGIVVSVDEKDIHQFADYGPLAGMYFQQAIENKAFLAGGGKFVAPALRLVDFVENKVSANLPDCSYLPGINIASFENVLPGFIHKNLQKAFELTGKKIKHYLTNEAIVVATESRTSSPVRIPRNTETLQHPQLKNLYPAGEGAGYAGGIVSAAMDGVKVAATIRSSLVSV